MWQKNNGRNEAEILQNQFTAYLVQAVQRRRNEYIRQWLRREQMEEAVEAFPLDMEYGTMDDMFSGLPLFMQLENNALYHALKKLNEQERYLFFSHVLDEKSFSVLAAEMHVSYKGVAERYYRIIRKIKKKLKEADV